MSSFVIGGLRIELGSFHWNLIEKVGMNILQLAPKVPFPLDEGGRISIYNTTKQLALSGAKVYFAALSENPKNENLGDLYRWCKDISVIKHKKHYGLVSIARSLFLKIPLNIAKFQSPAVLQALTQFGRKHKIDLIHVDYLHMAQYGLALKNILSKPAVLREHDLEIKMMQRFAEVETRPHLKFVARVQAKTFRRYQPEICAQFDKCIMVSADDERDLRQLAPRVKTTVIPIGVDTHYFRPHRERAGPSTICYLGSLDWFANVQGIRWFAKDVLPLVAKEHGTVKLLIYGSSPGRSVSELADGKRIFVMGFIEDAREAFRSATVFIAPEAVGSGLRIKILEAMAMGKPVVATSVSCEGIAVKHGRDILVADKPADFAREVSLLLSSERLRRSVSTNARRSIVRQYSWATLGRKFLRTYQDILEGYERN